MTATPTKPRLRRDYSQTLHRVVWFCRGQGVLGYADSPRNAYNDWKVHMYLRGLIPYPILDGK